MALAQDTGHAKVFEALKYTKDLPTPSYNIIIHKARDAFQLFNIPGYSLEGIAELEPIENNFVGIADEKLLKLLKAKVLFEKFCRDPRIIWAVCNIDTKEWTHLCSSPTNKGSFALHGLDGLIKPYARCSYKNILGWEVTNTLSSNLSLTVSSSDASTAEIPSCAAQNTLVP
ncbi:hypothetical protein ONS95_009176 [Cadophora gregata]|uniref:uncharacterized protein n=1 Tax=Cadophora gregata TaxID=51156 RepID=UPI0026DD6016|nr:uncharacterized protein ONS95_009176 [Cadophora gregata]KAK0124195.1 hypothetical protein ONS95_009176 [Cadophora gregata]KAK0129948.1 hypothetical protein ONS96_000490 [Cadophora gregata f. sp. sojae]